MTTILIVEAGGVSQIKVTAEWIGTELRGGDLKHESLQLLYTSPFADLLQQIEK